MSLAVYADLVNPRASRIFPVSGPFDPARENVVGKNPSKTGFILISATALQPFSALTIRFDIAGSVVVLRQAA